MKKRLALLLVAALACAQGPTDLAQIDLLIVSGDQQTAPARTKLPDPLVVKATDPKGKPVNQIVNFVVVQGGGTVFAGVALTNAHGLAQERWTLGSPGPQRLEVRAVDPATGDELVFGTFIATAVAVGDPGTSTITAAPTGIPADGVSTSTITVQLKESEGTNLTSGGDVVILNTTLGSLGVVSDNNDGTYTATLTAGSTDGIATITGTLNGTAMTDDAIVAVTALAVATLKRFGTADTLRGFMGSIMLPTPLVVARDAFGNPMNKKDITWTASAGDLGVPGLTSGVTRTSPDGIAVIQWWAAQAPGFAILTASMIDDLTGDTIYLEEPFVGVTEQTATWIAEFGDLNWSDGANWDIGRPPEPGELANFSASGNHTVTLDVSASVASILRTVRNANGDPFRSTGTKELVIPLGSFLVLTDTLVRADLPKVVLDGGGLTTSSGSLVDAEIHWTSGQVTMDRGGSGQSFSMFASGVGTKLLGVAPKVSATDVDVGINRITWDDASEWRIRGGPKLLFRNHGITVRGGDPLPGFGEMSVVSDDGLKPTLELTASATIAFQHVGSTPSTIILTGVDFVVGPSMSFTVTGDLPAIGQFYDLILLHGGSTFLSGAIPSDANYEFQVNPVPGVGLRAIRRQ